MAKLTKRMSVIREKVDATKQYDINEAISLLKELATAKFVESVDVAVNRASMLVNLTRTYVVQLYCRTVLAVLFALPYLHRARTLKLLKLQAPSW